GGGARTGGGEGGTEGGDTEGLGSRLLHENVSSNGIRGCERCCDRKHGVPPAANSEMRTDCEHRPHSSCAHAPASARSADRTAGGGGLPEQPFGFQPGISRLDDVIDHGQSFIERNES